MENIFSEKMSEIGEKANNLTVSFDNSLNHISYRK